MSLYKRGVRIKGVELRAFFPQGQSKLSVIMRSPYYAGFDGTVVLSVEFILKFTFSFKELFHEIYRNLNSVNCLDP